MHYAKRKVSVSLDEDLVALLAKSEGSLSAKINHAVRQAVERQARQRALGELLSKLEAEEGPVDEALLEKYERLLA